MKEGPGPNKIHENCTPTNCKTVTTAVTLCDYFHFLASYNPFSSLFKGSDCFMELLYTLNYRTYLTPTL
ncbi:hypothetical protein J45TS6_02610 [Paenibacillus sp. J45TS6]|nr:hypothetical protein J45TS6_02610 [Paenibacillus sp. J45TS6]